MNKARKNPAAEGQRLGLDFSQYEARPPLTHNEFLGQAAGAPGIAGIEQVEPSFGGIK